MSVALTDAVVVVGVAVVVVHVADLRRSTRWAGLRPGDPVQVTAPPTWRGLGVRGPRHHGETGDEWVEVVGGRAGTALARSAPTSSTPRRRVPAATRRWPMLLGSPGPRRRQDPVIPTLTTERLVLRPFTEADLAELAPIHAEPSFWWYPLRVP